MKNSNKLTKEYLEKLIAENQSAALEYIWEMRKTLNDCIIRKGKATKLNEELIDFIEKLSTKTNRKAWLDLMEQSKPLLARARVVKCST